MKSCEKLSLGNKRHFQFIVFLVLLANISLGQSYPDTLCEKRLKAVAWTAGVTYIGSMTALYGMWYSDYESTSFKFFDDSDEWLGMDKAGHSITAYQISRYGYDILRWTGLEDRKSMWWSSGVGLLFLTNVEVFDAYSKGWGFSWGDFGANVAGTGLFIGQQLLWNNQRMMLKISYSESDLAQFRPELLGSNTLERIFKDYNGQTAWLSISPGSFMENSWFPKWLCFSVGFGGQNMLGGSFNPEFNDAGTVLPAIDPYRQYYLSLDIDLGRLKTKSKFLNTVLSAVSVLKIPAPTAEFSRGRTTWHWLYF